MKKIALMASVVMALLFSSCDKKVHVEGVTLSKNKLTLKVGAAETLTATVTPEDADDKSVSWNSSDNKVAIVENGKVTAIKAGTAKITVTTTDGSKTASCDVTVTSGTGPGTESSVTVTFGSESWTAQSVYAHNYETQDVVGCWIFKTPYTMDWVNHPINTTTHFLNFQIPNRVGSASISMEGGGDNFCEYFENKDHVIVDNGEAYGDWWMLSGTVNITKFSGGKMSGTLTGTMLNAYELLSNQEPSTKSISITFSNIDFEVVAKASKSISNSIHRSKSLLNKQLQLRTVK
jgi:transglutaminase/protease-like cytokinesis protein 3